MINKQQLKSVLDLCQGKIERINRIAPEGYTCGYREAPSGSHLVIENNGQHLNLELHTTVACAYYYIEGVVDTLYHITDKNYAEIYSALGLRCFGVL